MRWSTALFLFTLTACGGERSSSQTESSETSSSQPSTRASSRRPEGLRIRAESFANGDVNPIVEATGDSPVELRGKLGLERLVNDDWTSVNGAGPDLRADCSSEAPSCVTLAKGGGLRPPRWNARARGGQCDARSPESTLPSGRYRFIATSCDGNHRVEGTAFDVTR